MVGDYIKNGPAWLQQLWRWRTWLLLAVIVLVPFSIRLRLLHMPLERDEGEYAYAGQLILQGVPPYKLVYNMKLPGTYAAYAVIMGIFGQSVAAIHFGLALVNAACIVLVFLIARTLIDDVMGLASAVTFALMSLSPAVLGLAAHATHFVVLGALGGTLLLLRSGVWLEGTNSGLNRREKSGDRGDGSPRRRLQSSISTRMAIKLAISGVLFGVAFVMKQHGIFFGVFAFVWLLCQGIARKPRNWLLVAKELGLFAVGFALPYAVMCLILASAGVFHQFVFWTFSYASKYVSAVPMAEGPVFLRAPLGGIFGTNPFFWFLPGLACMVMWWEPRLEGRRLFLTLFVICSIMAVSAGFYFREHYFIQLLPGLALLTGVGISRALYLLRHDKTIELFLAVAMLILFVLGIGTAFVVCSEIWFEEPPQRAVERVYGDNLFVVTAQAAKYLKEHASQDAKVAVLGSEPQIYFYSRHRSATPFIYTYPMMELHSYAMQMQEQLISDIENGRPDYIVFVNDDLSWLPQRGGDNKIFQWWDNYWTGHYDVEQSFPITETAIAQDNSQPKRSRYLLVLRRKSAA